MGLEALVVSLSFDEDITLTELNALLLENGFSAVAPSSNEYAQWASERKYCPAEAQASKSGGCVTSLSIQCAGCLPEEYVGRFGDLVGRIWDAIPSSCQVWRLEGVIQVRSEEELEIFVQEECEKRRDYDTPLYR